MRYIVYTELLNDDGFEAWYYGTYDNRDIANDVACLLNEDRSEGFHGVCPENERKEWEIKNHHFTEL